MARTAPAGVTARVWWRRRMPLADTTPLRDLPPRTGPRLVVVLDDGARVFPLPESGAATIGRADDQAVRIEHPTISRRHAVLHVGRELDLEDVGSANGVRTRGERFGKGKRVRVAPGEPFEIGGVLCFVDLPAGTLASAQGEKPETAGRASEAVIESPRMRELHELLERVARGSVSVLLLGETGVGKEVLAR